MAVHIDPQKILIKAGVYPSGPVNAYATKRAADYMDKYVPYREGNLAYKQRVIEKDKVIYNAPYAHYMYIGEVMGPNIPIMGNEGGPPIAYFSRPGKTYTGRDINYNRSAGHEYAGPQWEKRMWSAESQDLIREIQKFVNRGGR